MLGWYERTKADSAFVRSDQSATVASECAGEGLKGPWGEGVVNAWGGGNLGMCVCKHTVVRFLFFLAPRSLQAEKAKGQGGPPWPFSRGCQTYWEACQKCSGLGLPPATLPQLSRVIPSHACPCAGERTRMSDVTCYVRPIPRSSTTSLLSGVTSCCFVEMNTREGKRSTGQKAAVAESEGWDVR